MGIDRLAVLNVWGYAVKKEIKTQYPTDNLSLVAGNIINTAMVGVIAVIEEYDRQSKGQNHFHITQYSHHLSDGLGVGTVTTSHQYPEDYPKPGKCETCDCEGRKKLEDLGVLWKEGNAWRIAKNGYNAPNVTDLIWKASCPLCDKPLP